jgi:hypothetical protein
MRAEPTSRSVNVILKNPEITATGQTFIENSNFDGFLTPRGSLNRGSPFDFEGNLKMKFGYVDYYKEPYRQGTSSQFITYLQSVNMNGSMAPQGESLEIPGDISLYAKTQGEYIPLEKILSSWANVITLVFLSIATIIIAWLIRRGINNL